MVVERRFLFVFQTPIPAVFGYLNLRCSRLVVATPKCKTSLAYGRGGSQLNLATAVFAILVGIGARCSVLGADLSLDLVFVH